MKNVHKTIGIAILFILLTACLAPKSSIETSPKPPSNAIDLPNGVTVQLSANPTKKNIKGLELEMLGYNSQIPGPLYRVKQNTTILVNFTNNLDVPMGLSTVHWHGLRLENKFDGTPNITQPPVQPNQSFLYRLSFPDEGVYWYHSHLREDYQQELGLYGNILVTPEQNDYYNPVNREEMLVLDDISIERGNLYPFDKRYINHVLSGRFGNIMLVNGDPEYTLQLKKGEVVRFYVTNVANTRTFNLSIPRARMKLIGGDQGAFERNEFIESLVISVSERYIIEAFFESPGVYEIKNMNPKRHYVIGKIVVSEEAVEQDFKSEFLILNENPYIEEELFDFRHLFDKKVGLELLLTMEMQGAIKGEERGNGAEGQEPAQLESPLVEPIEWEDSMHALNRESTNLTVKWILHDRNTSNRNMNINYTWKAGEIVRIRIVNDPDSPHPMHHSIHFHGQRFLVLERDGVRNKNLVWKDTILVPAGSTVDILLEASNTGDWLAHCHIAEHAASGMQMSFRVSENQWA